MKRYCFNLYLISFSNETNAIREPVKCATKPKQRKFDRRSRGESERDENKRLATQWYSCQLCYYCYYFYLLIGNSRN